MAKLTKAQIAANQAAAQLASLNNLAGTIPANTNIMLPSKDKLEAYFKQNKLDDKTTKQIVDQYAGKPLLDTITKAMPTSSHGLVESIVALPEPLQAYMVQATGLENPAFGKDLYSRASKVLPFLQAAGNVDNYNVNLVSQYESESAALAQANSALTSGDRSINTSAKVGSMYTAASTAENTLLNWGIDTPELDALVTNLAKSGMTNVGEIMNQVRQTATYQRAYAGLAEYNAERLKNGDPLHMAMTENEYRSYTQAVQGAAQQYGNMTLNQQQIGQLLKGNVTATEFNQRMTDIGAAVRNANPQVKALLKSEFGINEDHLFHYLAHGSLPDMQRQVATAEIQDFSSRVGLAGLGKGQAGSLADMAKLASTAGNQGLGYGVSQIEGSLTNAARDVSLTKSAPGASAPTVNTQTLIASQLPGFGGISQVAAQTEVARAEQAKVAPFEKGGGYAESAKGVIGLGSART